MIELADQQKKTAEEIRAFYYGYRNSSPTEARRELAIARQMTDEKVVAVDYGVLYGIALRSDAERYSWTILPEPRPVPIVLHHQVARPCDGVLPGG